MVMHKQLRRSEYWKCESQTYTLQGQEGGEWFDSAHSVVHPKGHALLTAFIYDPTSTLISLPLVFIVLGQELQSS